MEGQATALWGVIAAEGWLRIAELRLVTLADMGLPENASDRIIWRFSQQHEMLLLTGNRNQKGADSLQQTISEESTSTSLPVLTVGSLDRLAEPGYRARCAERLMEVALYPERYLGAGRVFIP